MNSHRHVKNKSSFTPPRGRNTELDELVKNIGKTTIRACKPKGNLGRDERTALMKLRNNSNIVIKEADKGGAIIIIKKEQYKNMVTQHLQSNVYEREHDRNANTKVMKKIENLTDKYSDVLEEHETKYLTEFRPSTSNFYVLPKVHKSKIITNLVEEKSVEYLKIENPPEIPSRPIVAGPNSPTHRLSIFLDIILRPLTEKVTSYVRDDIDFLNYLPKKIDFASTFVSFDVTSLYTNISHELGIEAISYWIEQFPDFLVDDRFTKDFITEALRLVLQNNYFKFDGELWHQLVGTAMGTNVAVIYAILVMAYLERKLYTRVNEMYPADYAEYIIKNWRRFIDDCVLIWNNQ